MQTPIAYLVAARRYEIHELEQLNRTCELVRAVSELVQLLQRERGVSNVYRASEGQSFGLQWIERIADSDQAQKNVLAWLERIDPGDGLAGGSRLCTRIAIALNSLQDLSQIRDSVRDRTCSPAQSSEGYNRIVGALLALVFEAADVSVDAAVSRLLVALFNFMQGKEFVGQERATGARAFASGLVRPEDLQSLTHLIELQEQYFARFESFCGDTILTQWRALQRTMPMAEIERMRRKLITPDASVDPKMADPWFDYCTQRMDDMYLVETHVTTSLQQACQARVAQAQSELQDQQALMTDFIGTQQTLPGSVLISRLDQTEDSIDPRVTDAMGSRLTRAIFDTFQTQTHQLQAANEELAAVRAALDERKHIERAKGLLMAHHALSEDQAYSLLRQQAMSQNRRLVDVAHSVLTVAELLPKRK
jgi:hypothetical protein